MHDCWTKEPLPHPWLDLDDVFCGYDHRLEDPRCQGCYRQRETGPQAQLHAPRRDEKQTGGKRK